ncbi:MAG TPA: AsnC family transcriptional regulator [Verrucomicrobia bacterium]|nr:AsnC family transcriptional regulator [Verrucomicrobiota bacterium]
MDELLQILKRDARTPLKDIAIMLAQPEAAVQARVADYEATGIIRGYQALLNEELVNPEHVRAAIEVRMTPERGGGYDRIATRIARFPEVESVFLMSGGYDLLVYVKGENLRTVASFVNERLATIDGVLSTATHFTLKTYKDQGVLMKEEQTDERLQVSP